MSRRRPALLTYQHADGTSEDFQIDQEVTTLGRSDVCAIVIPLPMVSRIHATITRHHDRYELLDNDSANGTFINGNRLTQGHQLNTGDEIWLGSAAAALRFADPEETMLEEVPGSALAPLEIDDSARKVYVYGTPVSLSPLEYGLLLHLARHAGAVCTREECFLAAWGQTYDHALHDDALNACVAKLRRHLREAAHAASGGPPVITNIPRVGFRLDTEVHFADTHAMRW